MAGGKYFYTSKTGRSRRTRATKATTKKVSKPIKNYVKRAINANIETRQFIASQFATTIDYDNSPFVEDMTNIAQGDGSANRDGNVIKPCYLNIRYHLDGVDGDYCRLCVIQWKQDTASVTPAINIATSNNIFNNSVGSGTEYLSPFDEDYSKYYNVLYDALIPLNIGTGENKSGLIHIGMTKMNNIYFNDSATTGKNHLYILATSNKNNAGTPPTFSYISEFAYKDI